MRTSTLCITHSEVTRESLDAQVSGRGVMRKGRRIAVIQGILDGASPTELSRRHHISRQAIYNIAYRVNERGLQGLDDDPHPAPASKLTPELRKELSDVIEKPPKACGYRQGRWDGPLLNRYLEDHHGFHLGHTQIYKWLHWIGVTLQRGRQTFQKADPEEQKRFETEFKKKPAGVKRQRTL
jgi:transposase